MILNDEQIFEYINKLKQEQREYKKNLFYMSVAYHEYIDLPEVYSLTYNDRKLYNEVVKEYNEDIKRMMKS